MGRMPDMDLSDDDRPTPNRRSESDGARPPVRPPRPRGWRGLLDRERITSALRTLAWLVPLSVGIWVYAEREQVVYPLVPNASAPLKVTTTATDRYVELVSPPPPATVQLKLSGPSAVVETVSREISQGLTLDLAGLGPGNGQQVNVVDAAQNLPVFRSAGVTVLEAVPQSVKVNVDDVIDRPAIVEIDPQHVTSVLGTPTFTPPRVTLRGPKAMLDDLAQAEKPADGVLRVYADLSALDLRQPGLRPASDVPLKLPVHEDQIQRVPAQVQVRLQVRPADVPYDINPVPIFIDAPPQVWHDYDVRVNESDDMTIPHVHVTGPADKIDELKASNGQTVTAHLEVQAGDPGHEGPRRLDYRGLPEGVHVTPEDLDRTVTFKMTSRAPTPGG